MSLKIVFGLFLLISALTQINGQVSLSISESESISHSISISASIPASVVSLSLSLSASEAASSGALSLAASSGALSLAASSGALSLAASSGALSLAASSGAISLAASSGAVGSLAASSGAVVSLAASSGAVGSLAASSAVVGSLAASSAVVVPPSAAASSVAGGTPSFNHRCGNGIVEGFEQCDPGSTLGPVPGRFPPSTCCNFQCNWKKPGDACGNNRNISPTLNCLRTPRCQPVRGAVPIRFFCTGSNIPKRRGAGCNAGTLAAKVAGTCDGAGTCRAL